jgi:hypothetical protein
MPWLLGTAFVSQAEAPPNRPGFDARTGDVDGMEERRLVRILVPYSKTIYFIDGGNRETSSYNEHLAALDADGKPEIVVSSIGDNLEGKISSRWSMPACFRGLLPIVTPPTFGPRCSTS